MSNERLIEENQVLRDKLLKAQSVTAYYINQANSNQEKILELQDKIINLQGGTTEPENKYLVVSFKR